MRIYRTDQFPLPLPAGHRFPAEKYRLLAEQVAQFAPERLDPAPAASRYELLRAHDPAYVDAVLNGCLDARQQREIGLPWSMQLAERSRRSVGATIAASRSALQQGCGVNLAGGTHHAGRGRGSGFCVFNDVAVAALLMLSEGQIRRALVIDLDVHQGDGTAAITATEDRIFTFSMHGARNFPFDRVSSDLDIDLPDGTGDAEYLAILADALPRVFAAASPDLAYYLAGADPYRGDRLGRLALSQEGLARRDRLVMETCRRHGAALVVAMAGGYAVPITDTVTIQTETVRLACRIFGAGELDETVSPRR
ncbi:histone deacetylase [Chromobacterium subtsugae]|uniref:Histone deacetylase n=1 Tax=Chromobacterium subtsugae TaxID=251747 RepID=A0ABS7FEE6_9NEIS|nr:MULTISPECIES: histone deacetylase [Chromobacterium]KUM04839.1 deacetylase [Chromobacterium subtsugae]KZE87759.1 deacetylase [Chromobacterium sp. F49]MBW7568232.1 histone deacetylase [Chromobacterium subtsugae]MBW8288432.1 histone deacetylase [Chromobacterium subtsugae]WSE89958.1 histone deacetylase [Chromobacterium subtsugae]